jgi:dipeptidyl aminopeptidase/acylaminoacyl peptidase
MSIERLRAGSYPGSALTVERTLTAGQGYKRFIASYRSEGLKIQALLTVPQGKAPAAGWPAVAFMHGYIPPAQYRTTERYERYVDAITRAGYIVLKPDLRGHGSSQGTAEGAYWSPGYSIDTLNAVASLRRFPKADGERLAMWGHSMGGFLTLRAIAAGAKVRAAVIWAGVVAPYSDLLGSWSRRYLGSSHDRAGGPDDLIDRHGSPSSNPRFWNTLSATSYLQKAPPIQLHHSPADTHVPYTFSEKLAATLKAAGRTRELYSYPGDDHNLSRNFANAMRRTVAFLDRHLKK